MSSLPGDSFNTNFGGFVEPCDRPSFVYHHKQYHANAFGVWNPGPPGQGKLTTDPAWVLWPEGIDPEWVLYSQGPSATVDGVTTYITAIPYDPSNGTISHGEIVTYGLG
ncbi:MAG: hypothetical protein PWP23_2422 [Candidatus Sumerlaeota bacterium]|nr:hypothetical protein [Candidatus Sumerlaeota bacterium]